jgi:bifunctional non-homologous end joining protein LigD
MSRRRPSERVAPPADLAPMLATLVHDVPLDEGWAYEMKWDGVRAFLLVDGSVADAARVRVTNRKGGDITAGYPEFAVLGDALGPTPVLLDGEIVAIDDNGRPSFQLLQRRMHVRDPAALRRLTQEVPVAFMAFDLLWRDGDLLTGLPYTERRGALQALEIGGARWQVPPASTEHGDAALATSRDLGLEGIVAKRLDSRYESGRRSPAWRKVKHELRQELVVGGWSPGEGWRSGGIGALLLGYYEADGTLHYAGKVGTGFSEQELERLEALLAPIERRESPFAGPGVPRTAHFVEPTLVAEVRFTEWTDGGRIRHPAYLGLRDDKAARDVTREG